jgi:hypothetical protein
MEMTTMKSDGFDRLGVLLVLMGAVSPGFAAQEQHGAPEKQQEQARPAARPEQQHQAQQERQPQPQRPQAAKAQEERQQPRPQQPQPRANRPAPQRGHAGGQQAAWQDHRAHDFRSEHRDWQQRGGYHGYRIPEDRFRGHFGENHRFRMSGYAMVMFGGHPRFRYGGFWMNVLDPWPETWAANWYGNDDVYIGFSGGGYYLYNTSYPGDSIALSVTL